MINHTCYVNLTNVLLQLILNLSLLLSQRWDAVELVEARFDVDALDVPCGTSGCICLFCSV